MFRILIVDDDKQVLEQLSELLSSFGYSPHYVPRAEFVFDRLNSEEFDLILLDINMPGMNGIEMLRKLRKIPKYKHFPVIMITGIDDNRTLAECFKLGVNDYIEKPINQLVLRARVNSVIRNRQYIQKIENQRSELELKNHEIQDSINYAKMIQESILPPLKQVNGYFKNSFITYLPKDIVSGDFYWTIKKNNKILIAAVDSTGHGVPGAIISVIGYTGLNQAVRERDLTRPSEILNYLNNFVNETLHKTGRDNEMGDGMDMALCSIDCEARTIEYAGAINPVYIIEEGELIEIRGDRMPIGSLSKNGGYTDHKRVLKEGSSVYIFSDGYADQFGGKLGKSFKKKRFKELLMEICDKPMKEQDEILKKTISDWMGDLEQLDDICVIGLRI